MKNDQKPCDLETKIIVPFISAELRPTIDSGWLAESTIFEYSDPEILL